MFQNMKIFAKSIGKHSISSGIKEIDILNLILLHFEMETLQKIIKYSSWKSFSLGKINKWCYENKACCTALSRCCLLVTVVELTKMPV